MFNGMPMTEVTETACNKGSIFAWKDGIVTRGVLMDIPRLKGVEYLEPGTRIYPEDLDAWVKKARDQESSPAMRCSSGRADGRFAIRRDRMTSASSPGSTSRPRNGSKQHDVAILGSDGAQDVHPSGIEGISEPIHALVAHRDGRAHIRQPRSRSASAREAARRNRWDFLVTASPAAVPGATGSCSIRSQCLQS